MKRQSGFTLIELVTVIVILGILAAFALPRFAGLESQARRASLQGLTGSIRSASALAHAVWLANGSDDATVTLEGQAINITNGYPTVADIDLALQDPNLPGFTQAVAGTIVPVGAATPANCQVVYAAAGVGGTPGITVTDTGC